MKFLLSVIAVCLVMIVTKLYVPQAEASVNGMNWGQLIQDKDFNRAVQEVVKDKCRVNNPVVYGHLYCSDTPY